jgi:hypothetical protein
MRLQQMTELADRALIRRRFVSQINADETAHGPRAIQGVLPRFHGRLS